MNEILSEGSDLSSGELSLLRMQCDLVEQECRILSTDDSDCLECIGLLSRIKCDIVNRHGQVHGLVSVQRFSNFECIGKGAFGLVFAADDRLMSKRVAIKILRPSKVSTLKSVVRFESEGRILSELTHPHIIRALETGCVDALPYIIMEWANCGSVSTILEDEKRLLTIRQVVWIVWKVAEALEDAHASMHLHRDLKPGNILLTSAPLDQTEGLGLNPLLTDFGLAKTFDSEPSVPLTSQGEILGTLTYMSPEQIQGLPLKPTSDIFSLGVILFELVYGQHPFREDGHYRTLTNIVQKPPIHLGISRKTLLKCAIPRTLQAIIFKCLEKDPTNRYRYSAQLADDLGRFLRGESISIVLPTFSQSLRRFVLQHPVFTTAFSSGILCLCMILGLISWGWRVKSKLAFDNATISQLFLSSIRSFNTELNDSILAGKRIPPSQLLGVVNEQIPLLEQAYLLAPHDQALLMQLQIMYHYKSLCLSISAFKENGVRVEPDCSIAIQARDKSLLFIESLIHASPDRVELYVARLNGLFHRSVLCSQHEDGGVERLRWNLLGIDAATEFLKRFPGHADATETLINLKIDRADCLLKDLRRVEEGLHLLADVYDLCHHVFRVSPVNIGMFVTYIQRASINGCRLLQSRRKDESDLLFNNIEYLVAKKDLVEIEDWRLHGAIESYYVLRSCTHYRLGQFRDVLEVTNRWRSFALGVSSLTDSSFFGEFFEGREMSRLLALYIQWLALREVEGGSDREIHAKQDVRNSFLRFRRDSVIEADRFIEIIRTQIPTQALDEWSMENAVSLPK